MKNTPFDPNAVGQLDRTTELMIRARRLRAEAAGEMVRDIGRAGRRLLKRK